MLSVQQLPFTIFMVSKVEVKLKYTNMDQCISSSKSLENQMTINLFKTILIDYISNAANDNTTAAVAILIFRQIVKNKCVGFFCLTYNGEALDLFLSDHYFQMVQFLMRYLLFNQF